jgi:hypothetical protein
VLCEHAQAELARICRIDAGAHFAGVDRRVGSRCRVGGVVERDEIVATNVIRAGQRIDAQQE